MSDSKFKIGDKVRIIGYGHLFWSYDKPSDKIPTWYDMSPELVGQIGIIANITNTQGIPKYALKGPNKYAWYDEKQLEKVLPAP